MRVVCKTRISTALFLFPALFSLTACHPWFKMGPGAPPDQVPVVVSPDGTPYIPGTPTWVPLIDECMANGDRRNTCIENLPEAEREKLEAWEADRANSRRQLLEARTQRQ